MTGCLGNKGEGVMKLFLPDVRPSQSIGPNSSWGVRDGVWDSLRKAGLLFPQGGKQLKS